MTRFLSELQPRLERLLARTSVRGSVESTLAAHAEAYEDVLDATEAQWSLFGSVVDELLTADDVYTLAELSLPLQYFCHAPIEPLDDEALMLGLPFDEFPEGTERLCGRDGVILAIDGIWSAGDYGGVEMLLVSTGEHEPGEAGTEQLVVVTRDEILRFEDPLAYMDALLARG